MPIYGYECSECGHKLEVLQSVNDPPLQTCPECGGPVRKLFYPVGVIFKGSGFYSTDYKSSSNGKSSSSESGGDNKAGGDSKPAAKAEKKPEKSSDTKPSGD
jgi:putative FmdB family regulatory protein